MHLPHALRPVRTPTLHSTTPHSSSTTPHSSSSGSVQTGLRAPGVRSAVAAVAAALSLTVLLGGSDAARAQMGPGQVYGGSLDRERADEAVERAGRIGVLFASPQAAAQLRTGVLRHLDGSAPLPPPTTVVPNPDTVDMRAGWAGDAGGDLQESEIAARAVDLARRSGMAVGPLRSGLTPGTSTTSTSTPGTSAGGPARSGLVCPVQGQVSFINDWGFPRSGGRSHRGNDMFALEGTPVVAVRPAVITRVSRADRGLGGLTVSYIDDRGDRWYNAHLSAIAPGIDPGTLVDQGQVIGYVGRTGNARTTPPHNHIQWHLGNGDPVNPYFFIRPVC